MDVVAGHIIVVWIRGLGLVRARVGVDGLPVDRFPECGAFVVGEGVEEGFAEGGVGVEGGRVEGVRLFWGCGGRVAVGAVVVVVVVATVAMWPGLWI